MRVSLTCRESRIGGLSRKFPNMGRKPFERGGKTSEEGEGYGMVTSVALLDSRYRDFRPPQKVGLFRRGNTDIGPQTNTADSRTA